MLSNAYARCHPAHHGEQCLSCARWDNHPNQTWPKGVASWNVTGTRDKQCHYLRIEIHTAGETLCLSDKST